MGSKINEKRVNLLAATFAQTKDQHDFTDLFTEIYPYLHAQSLVASYQATQRRLSIPKEDFESFFCQGLFQAASGFNASRGDFMPRLQYFFRLREADVYRAYQNQVTKGNNITKHYDKAKLESLDRKVTSNEYNDISLGEIVLPQVPSAEQIYLEDQINIQVIQDLREKNVLYAKVAYLLILGYNNRELATAFGEESYNAKMRKLVQRTRAYLKKCIEKSKAAK